MAASLHRGARLQRARGGPRVGNVPHNDTSDYRPTIPVKPGNATAGQRASSCDHRQGKDAVSARMTDVTQVGRAGSASAGGRERRANQACPATSYNLHQLARTGQVNLARWRRLDSIQICPLRDAVVCMVPLAKSEPWPEKLAQFRQVLRDTWRASSLVSTASCACSKPATAA